MPPILINVIQGFSALVRPESSTVSHLVRHVLAPYKDDVRINVENPGDRHCIRRSLAVLSRSSAPAVLIGKSLGGIRTWWMLRRYAAELAQHHESVSVIFIDPHGWQVGDSVVGSYGRNRPLPYFTESDAFSMVNFYQHNKWPCVAVFEGQDFNRELSPGADHWNCTDVGSGESELIRREIREARENILLSSQS